ncbi:MAG: hypothetical protein U0670_05465 [Anaerolineae bacterium]
MSLSPRFFTLIRLLLLLSLVAGNAMYCIVSVAPQWTAFSTMEQDVAESEGTLTAVAADQHPDDEITIAREQLSMAEAERAQSASLYLTQPQQEAMLNYLYDTADQIGVVVVRVQAQAINDASNAAVIEANNYAVQVQGPFRNLMTFVALFRWAQVPSVSIVNMNIQGDDSEATLSMTLYTYQSAYASGSAFDPSWLVVPTLEPSMTPFPTRTPTETPTVTPTVTPTTTATATPTFTPASTDTVQPVPLPTETPALELTVSAALTQTLASLPTVTGAAVLPETAAEGATQTAAAIGGSSACSGVLQSLLAPGQTAVVDFNDTGALRIMSWIRQGASDTLVQAYDNDRLSILAGPVCGDWGGLPTWYWYVEFAGVRGWAAEGTTEERWLCPSDTPECAN